MIVKTRKKPHGTTLIEITRGDEPKGFEAGGEYYETSDIKIELAESDEGIVARIHVDGFASIDEPAIAVVPELTNIVKVIMNA